MKARLAQLALVSLAFVSLAGCGRRPHSEDLPPERVPPGADAPLALALPAGELPPDSTPVRPPIVAVAPQRAALDVPLPEPAPGEPPPANDRPVPPPVSDVLQPPILRESVRVTWPPRVPRRGVVELDVRVDERGEVSDAIWAAGLDDSLLVGAAIDAALRQRFLPAIHRGAPVAVWCRQRFDPRGASVAPPDAEPGAP